ncbi:LL-diaminopimelate aminotransferase [Paenibacillus sp. PK3_47]|uniref:pyridoxal phosphate-dependent aminotransferase n=1 Tax=Paenibacillus sp. PK3_47 TaxID=2072642 RepID=UPI00201DF993|nr:pyridoxal phosphate-dependent aminotransferase [Paenibacillus sp. PK3_47]UQZ34688.1 LL-diaminopimelate aminotransferase [Paenibacillus sp. PK3_47]
MNHFEPSHVLNSLPKQFFAELVARAGQVAREGHDVINLGQGNPDMPTPPHIVEALLKGAQNADNHRYPPFRGHGYFKEAAAAFYKREYGVELDPQREIAILFGGKTGLVEVVQCLLNPGDTALVPDPGYPDYWSGIELARAVMEMMPLTEERGYLPDYTAISAETAAKAKLMFLNYPNNPTGAVADGAFFAETVRFAAEHHICVVHDFAYAAIGYEGRKPVSFLQTPGAKDNGIEIYTLSKTYNMAGWRVAFAAGNASVIESLNLLQDHMYVSLFGAVQEAAAAALSGPQECVRENVNRYETRRNLLINGLQDLGWEVEAPGGSFFAWLPVPDGFTSQSFADLLLNQAHVVVAPGIGFGTHGEGYVRVGLVSDEARLAEAVKRIAGLQLFQQK